MANNFISISQSINTFYFIKMFLSYDLIQLIKKKKIIQPMNQSQLVQQIHIRHQQQNIRLIEEHCKCSISNETMANPVITVDGQTYQNEFIKKWFKNSSISPLTGLHLKSKQLIPNIILKNMIPKIQDLITLEQQQKKKNKKQLQNMKLKKQEKDKESLFKNKESLQKNKEQKIILYSVIVFLVLFLIIKISEKDKTIENYKLLTERYKWKIKNLKENITYLQNIPDEKGKLLGKYEQIIRNSLSQSEKILSLKNKIEKKQKQRAFNKNEMKEKQFKIQELYDSLQKMAIQNKNLLIKQTFMLKRNQSNVNQKQVISQSQNSIKEEICKFYEEIAFILLAINLIAVFTLINIVEFKQQTGVKINSNIYENAAIVYTIFLMCLWIYVGITYGNDLIFCQATSNNGSLTQNSGQNVKLISLLVFLILQTICLITKILYQELKQFLKSKIQQQCMVDMILEIFDFIKVIVYLYAWILVLLIVYEIIIYLKSILLFIVLFCIALDKVKSPDQ